MTVAPTSSGTRPRSAVSEPGPVVTSIVPVVRRGRSVEAVPEALAIGIWIDQLRRLPHMTPVASPRS